MQKSLFIVFFLAFLSSGYGQKTTEFGPFLGRSYYLGEINPTKHFGGGVGTFAIGGVFRYNLNKRYSLKASLIQTSLVGEDKSSDLNFNQGRKNSFKTKLTEFSTQIEFNFLPYATGDKKHFFSPYLFIGASAYLYNPSVLSDGKEVSNSATKEGNGYAFPFGPGIKLSLGRKLSLNIEWGFRKTDNDFLDGLLNRINTIYENGKEYDKDWYVLSGFTLTYRLSKINPCPTN